MRPRICLITPGHIASTPRLVKEADALTAAGYDVTVVAGRHFAPVRPLDDTILERARWSYQPVDLQRGFVATGRKVLRQVARRLLAQWPDAPARWAARAQHADSVRLSRLAATIPSDLYLGHCLAGLAAAGMAAEQRRVRLGFDAEDLHRFESSSHAPAHAVAIERHWLPRCVHLTASAPLIAQAYARACGIPAPEVVLNVFPRNEAPPAPVPLPPISAESPARLYWFSQTIGPGRGLEQFIAIIGRMRTPAQLHLRGFVADNYRRQLESMAATQARAFPIVYLPSAPPRELVRLAAANHAGLCLELPEPPNHDLCLANKIFVHLLAGIPQFLSATEAHRALAPQLGDAVRLIELGDAGASAHRIDAVLSDAAGLEAARREAWRLGHERFCWDVQQTAFLGTMSRAMPIPSS